jgi:hypothetical protein
MSFTSKIIENKDKISQLTTQIIINIFSFPFFHIFEQFSNCISFYAIKLISSILINFKLRTHLSLRSTAVTRQLMRLNFLIIVIHRH